MHSTAFAAFSLLIVLATCMALIARMFKQPLIIGHILTGVIAGPAVLHLIKNPETVEMFSSIGHALLLFIIGLGLNIKVIKEIGKVASIGGVLEVGLSAVLGWAIGTLLGLSPAEAIVLGLAVSFSSTIIIIKLLTDRKEQSRLYGKITTGILLVEDLLAALALLVVTAHSPEHGFAGSELVLLFIKGVAIALPVLFVGIYVLPRFHKFIAGNQEFLFIFAIGWGLGTAALFELIGFSLEIGALIAGVALASLPYTQEISARLRPVRDFFIVLFFISIGAKLTFDSIGSLIPLIIAICVIVMVLRPIIILTILGLFGYTKRTSFKTAISMTQVSEFSLVLVILASASGLVSKELTIALTISALITIGLSTYLILYADRIFTILEKWLSLFERRKTHFVEQESRNHHDLILFGYQKGGHEFVSVFRALKKRFVVIDYNPEVIDTLEHHKIEYLYGDAMDVELLEEAGLDKAKLVVSTITDHETNLFLIKLLEKINPKAVAILHADSVAQAAELYELGAAYVVIPHYIGSEKIGSFIKKTGFKKSEYKRYREKHLAYLESHYALAHDAYNLSR